MKKIFCLIVVATAILFAYVSCSQNASLPSGNVKPGSSSDPFANSKWTLVNGNATTKIIEFQKDGRYIYGGASNGVGVEMKGNYSVKKNGNEYIAYCLLTSGGESEIITLELDSFNSSSGILRIETVYYTVYRY